MKNLTYNPDSESEKTVEQLQEDTFLWDKWLHVSTDEIIFLRQLLSSDIFEKNTMEFFETLHEKVMELEEFKAEKMDLHVTINNHKNDLNGMRECEDISCDMFYHSEHKKLEERVQHFISKFQELKLEIYNFITPHFRKIKPQED